MTANCKIFKNYFLFWSIFSSFLAKGSVRRWRLARPCLCVNCLLQNFKNQNETVSGYTVYNPSIFQAKFIFPLSFQASFHLRFQLCRSLHWDKFDTAGRWAGTWQSWNPRHSKLDSSEENKAIWFAHLNVLNEIKKKKSKLTWTMCLKTLNDRIALESTTSGMRKWVNFLPAARQFPAQNWS